MPMYNLIRVELFKLRKNRAFWVLSAILAVLSMAYPLLYYFDNMSAGKPQMTGAEFLLQFIGGNGGIIKLGVATFAGFFICNEYSSGVMKTIASSGNERWKLYTAKLCVFALGAMAISLVFPLVSTVEATLLAGFGQLPEASGVLFILRVLGLTWLYACSYAAVAALFAVILTDSGKTIGFALIFFMAVDLVLGALGAQMPFFRTIHEHSIFQLVGIVGKISLGSGEALKLVLVPLLTFAAAGLLGMLVFRRKEIK